MSIVLFNSILQNCCPWYGNVLEKKLPYCGRRPSFFIDFGILAWAESSQTNSMQLLTYYYYYSLPLPRRWDVPDTALHKWLQGKLQTRSHPRPHEESSSSDGCKERADCQFGQRPQLWPFRNWTRLLVKEWSCGRVCMLKPKVSSKADDVPKIIFLKLWVLFDYLEQPTWKKFTREILAV